MKLHHFLLAILISLFNIAACYAQNISIVIPSDSSIFEIGTLISIEANVSSVIPGDPVHLNVSNTLTGYRKLKLGNNPNSIYSPKVNVSGGGNTHLSITLRDNTGNANWSRIRFKPQSLGNLNLTTYVNSVGGIGIDWVTLSIPLSDFDASIDFTQIAYIEFPYSADAGGFDIDFSDISFTGGSYPYQWFGTGKFDNIHNGNSGPGELSASLIPATLPISNVEKVEFYSGSILLSVDYTYPFTSDLNVSVADTLSINSLVYYDDQTSEYAQAITVFIENPPAVPNIEISLTSPADSSILDYHSNLLLQADVIGAIPNEVSYLKISNTLPGYRKLKLGYDPANIYASGQNVLLDGNDTLEIVMKETTGFTNWSKIRLRPNAIGSLSLAGYVNQASDITDWSTIKIPLADFDPLINFYALSYFEFPYSADAGLFEISVQSIKFTGGNTGFLFFGETKTDNAHNGNGGPGEVNAQLIEPPVTGLLIEKVEFFNGSILLYEDSYTPYQFEWNSIENGSFYLSSKVTLNTGLTSLSDTVLLTVNEALVGTSPLSISIISPLNGDSVISPTQINIATQVDGLPSGDPTHLYVQNNQSGYRKLKLGYDASNIYGPANNVTAAGNDTIKIVLKDFIGTANWQQIRLRPAEIGSLNLLPYLPSQTGDWFEIKIPLSDFDASIDFTQLAYMEFPYSADAGYFELGIQSIEFTGGTNPFIWFNENKYDNQHNGNGGPGELTATVNLFDPSPLAVQKIEFYTDTLKIGELTSPPFQISWDVLSEGAYPIVAVLTDSDSLLRISDTVHIHASNLSGPKTFTITVLFDTLPSYCNVIKAPVKYNKSFAYSFSLDDGKEDGFTHAYKVMNGGYITETQSTHTALKYTDGCGNDHSFTGALAWVSVNSSYFDLHQQTPSYMTWTQLSVLYNAGWDVLNHSYSHASYNNTNYNFEILQNESYVIQQAGIQMSHFVIPSGDQGYLQPAFNNGYKAVYAYNGAYLGANTGIQLDNPLNYSGMQIYRRFIHDAAFDTTNISQKIDQIASACQAGNHYWWNDFTHRVVAAPTGGSLNFSTFEWYLSYIEQTYGKNGSDCVWMAPLQEVYEYSRAKDESTISYFLNGNQLQITVDYSDLPEDLRRYALTLAIDADATFQIVSSEDPIIESFNGLSSDKIINLNWTDEMEAKATKPIKDVIEREVEDKFVIYPNPNIDGVLNVEISSAMNDSGVLTISTISGISIYQNQIEVESREPLSLSLKGLELTAGTYLVSYHSILHNYSRILVVQ
jgi:hypothetical protein